MILTSSYFPIFFFFFFFLIHFFFQHVDFFSVTTDFFLGTARPRSRGFRGPDYFFGSRDAQNIIP